MGTGSAGLAEFSRGEEIGGFVQMLEEWDEEVEPVGLLMAQAWPGGPINAEARQWFCETALAELDKTGNLDGLLLSLHGSLVAEDEADMEGLLLQTIRSHTGNRLPIVVSLDLHAYMTPRMIRLADCIVAYHTAPHIDRFQTGRRAARSLLRILSGAEPEVVTAHIPILATGELTMTNGPAMRDIYRRIVALEDDDRIISAALLMAQPWLEVPNLGWTVYLASDGHYSQAGEVAEEVADLCWSRREQLRVEPFDALDSVDQALAIKGKPVVVADGADSTNSGACGDSTHLLKALLSRKVPERALTIMVDPQAVAHAQKSGAGNQFVFEVGGKRDNVYSKPLPINGLVKALQPARFTLSGHLGDNLPIDMGLSATVRVGDVDLLLVEKTGPGSSPQMYRCVGLEPKDYKIVIVKSPGGFRADFEPFAAGIVLSSCPGCASPQLAQMEYKHISRPVWPLDTIDDWRQVEWIRGLNRLDWEASL